MATLKVTLGGRDYDVPKLNVGQIRRIVEGGLTGFAALGVAFERVDGKPNVEDIESDVNEIKAAIETILAASGMKKADAANPPKAPEGNTSGATSTDGSRPTRERVQHRLKS